MNDEDSLEAIRARFAPGWSPIISIKPGWIPLLLELDAALVEVAPDLRYHQIKEKYGGLRVYTTFDGEDAEVDALLRQAEQRAARTCEICGGAGRLRQRLIARWFKTLCDECAEVQGYGEVNRNVR